MSVITTKRLALREIHACDVDFVSQLLADPGVMRFYPKAYSRAEAEAWVERRRAQYESHGYSLWIVEEIRSGTPVGTVGLVPQVVDGAPEDEIGYLLASDRWGHGFATEAAAGVRDFAFTELEKHRLISLVRPVNEPSQRVAQRIGMRVERTTMFADLEHLVFSITAPASA